MEHLYYLGKLAGLIFGLFLFIIGLQEFLINYMSTLFYMLQVYGPACYYLSHFRDSFFFFFVPQS